MTTQQRRRAAYLGLLLRYGRLCRMNQRSLLYRRAYWRYLDAFLAA